MTEPAFIYTDSLVRDCHTYRTKWYFSYWPSQVMFFILTETDDVIHTDRARWCFHTDRDMWCFSYWQTGDVFILTETGGVFYTDRDRWCFSYWPNQAICFTLIESSDGLRTDGAKWWKSFWETGDHNSGRDIYILRLAATLWSERGAFVC